MANPRECDRFKDEWAWNARSAVQPPDAPAAAALAEILMSLEIASGEQESGCERNEEDGPRFGLGWKRVLDFSLQLAEIVRELPSVW